ncbi:FAD/NAD-P-binding domain-containing protein [Mycena sanguinolenta]|nr:FAD/NAD-P-binding domain-containing protein [Mycena sanguinolenta]
MPNIVVVGAGVGGLSFGIALRRQLHGFDDFTIYEKAPDVGGTWRDNIYPGAASDVSTHFYSASTDLNPNWSVTHAPQPEMFEYWRKLTAKYDLYRQIVFNRSVVSAEWNIKEQLYHIVTEDVQSGARFSTTAKILISALGLLNIPRYPNIAGLSSFKGDMFHSARWNTGVDLRGKRVAVIGIGASAIQFVPFITEDETVQVTEFCRSPNWFVPARRSRYSPLWKWTFKYVPLAMRFYRLFLYLRSETTYLAIFANKSRRAKDIAILLTNYIKVTAPKEYHEFLVPDYRPGCKRLLLDTNFLRSLHRPNIKLTWDGIQSVCEDGIVTKKGEKLLFDVVIFATGFTADTYPIKIVGEAGKTVQEYYESQNGPKAYLGTTVPGFPNFFMIGGPNIATGHTSAICTEELQIGYILQFVRPLLSNLVATFDVTPLATDAYNEVLQTRFAESVWMTCSSWYRAGSEGKVFSIFPGPMFLFAWWTRAPRWDDYKVTPTSRKWGRQMWREKWLKWMNPSHYFGILIGLCVAWLSD